MLGALGAARRRATWSEPEGGYFLWVDLPVDAGELLARAEAAGVTFVKGADFFPGGDGRCAVGPARLQLRVAVGDRGGRLHPRVALLADGAACSCESSTPPTSPASSESRITQISEVRASAKTKSTDASWSLPTTKRDQIGADQDQQAERDPEPRLPAPVELVARRLVPRGLVHAGRLRCCEGRRRSRTGDEAWLSGRRQRTRRRKAERRAGVIAGESAQARSAEVAIIAACFSTLAHIPSCSCLVPPNRSDYGATSARRQAPVRGKRCNFRSFPRPRKVAAN